MTDVQKRFITVERLERVALEALAGGYGSVATWRDGSGYRRLIELGLKHNCEQPYVYELHARWSAAQKRRKKPLMIRGTARCRKCEACMQYRGYLWQSRCKVEFDNHRMTLFGTFTMSPEQHYLLDARIERGTLAERGPLGRAPRSLRSMSPNEIFGARVQAFGDELTDWLKRIREGREGEKPQLRYLLVAETHNGEKTSEVMRGRPHYHVMLHTNTPQVLVKGIVGEQGSEWFPTKDGHIYVSDNAWLRKQWTYGFTKFELAKDAKAAWYVCKYISKALTCRVRASQRYGQDAERSEASAPSIEGSV